MTQNEKRWIGVEDELPRPNEKIKVAYIPPGDFYFDGIVWRQTFTPKHGGWIGVQRDPLFHLTLNITSWRALTTSSTSSSVIL